MVVGFPDVDLSAALSALGYETFRPGQREAIETLLAQRRLLLVAPTGGGKSLTYQLPAALLPGTTVVVSPLIALMQDQVQALESRGVAASFLASTLAGDELRRRMAMMAAGELRIVYVSPERLSFPGFREILGKLDCPLLAVDEAHCISEWGHDFRPEYMTIGDILPLLPKARVLACTATATPVVRDEILTRLGLPADTTQMIHGFSRPNLVLRAHEVVQAKQRRAAVDGLLAEALGKPGLAAGAAIVYAPTRATTERESARLAKQGWRVAAYHAGLSGKVRERVQKRFITGRLDVVVATNAFGMGIDRADVRAVIHLSPPSSIEAYYQEVGRAGRDGERAWGLLLSSTSDLALRRKLIESPVDDRLPDPRVVEHKWSLFLELMRWVEGGSCRHDAILRYFGDDDEVLGGCGQCDVCEAVAAAPDRDVEQITVIVRKALSGVARAHGRLGLQAVAKLLRGVTDPRLGRLGLQEVRTFGVLSEYPEPWLIRLLRRCVTAGWIGISGDDRPVVGLTPQGRAVMRGEIPARLVLPPDGAATGSAPGQGARSSGSDAEVPVDGALFEALRAHRMAIAQREGVPAYVVASDRTLRDLTLIRPRSREELLSVHGIGPAKADRFGEGLLDVVRQHGEQAVAG